MGNRFNSYWKLLAITYHNTRFHMSNCIRIIYIIMGAPGVAISHSLIQSYWWKLSKSLNADFALRVIYGSALSMATPHMLEEVPLNISRRVQNHWPNSALWSTHIISTQNRGVKTPLFNFVSDFLESWPSHTCFD